MQDSLIEKLEATLFDPRHPEALDYFGVHGVLTAECIGRTPLAFSLLKEIVWGATDVQTPEGFEALKAVRENIRSRFMQALQENETPPVPEDVLHDDDARINWCAGFLEVVDSTDAFLVEPPELQEQIASLLVPVVTFAEEAPDSLPDKLVVQLLEQLQDNLLDLHLTLHATQN